VKNKLPQVFLDCDGVLADFDSYALDLFGKLPRQYEEEIGSELFWQQLEAHGSFYRDLPLMPDARDLYDAVKHLDPVILTGSPKGDWARGQKIAWAEEHFPGVPVIVCKASEKFRHMKGPGDVLIDDWHKHRHHWIAAGGVFISHVDAKSSIKALWAHYPEMKP
jgi:hypothetical protein